MEIITPLDNNFEYYKVKNLWNKCKDKLDDGGDFNKVIQNSHFFSFYSDNKLIGCICFYEKNDKLFLNGFSNRKMHQANLVCLKKALDFYNCDVYAECKEKPAILCLLKTGFKKIKDNLYKYERKQ